MLSAIDALEILRQGNRRFVSGSASVETRSRRSPRNDVVTRQQPFAVVLGCADSRVPVEIIFDRAFGDLFVIRVAGNIVDRSQIGSIEFAAEQFGTRLIVVLGHSRCGAVEATLEDVRRPGKNHSPNVHFIIDRIRPAVEELLTIQPTCNPADLLRGAVRANVRAAANALRRECDSLGDPMGRGALMVVGAEYSLETGVVEFFDGLPETG